MLIVTVYTIEEANAKAKEGYELVSVNKMTTREWANDGGAHNDVDYLAYTLVCKFMQGMVKNG